jgi:ABC-2 type transport system ATP-binding protein
MRDAAFITDVAVLPRWLRVSQALDFAAGIHPRFDRAKAEALLAKTSIKPASKVRELSKGMVTELHLAIVMAIDARLLVLDEPTLGLDLIYRKRFYDALLSDYFEEGRTVLLATHQVEEVQHVLTDVLYIHHGRIVFNRSMEDIEAQFHEVLVHPDRLTAARALTPIAERQGVGHSVLIFEGRDRQQFADFGEVRTPSVADLFLAVVR